ncbi:hypothetical protein [Marisediminitalea sp.]|uniref:hypothetical protein n=1 Tax=Marisediminitalea sp. TaxID=2662268 RepID=UPI00351806ED
MIERPDPINRFDPLSPYFDPGTCPVCGEYVTTTYTNFQEFIKCSDPSCDWEYEEFDPDPEDYYE